MQFDITVLPSALHPLPELLLTPHTQGSVFIGFWQALLLLCLDTAEIGHGLLDAYISR